MQDACTTMGGPGFQAAHARSCGACILHAPRRHTRGTSPETSIRYDAMVLNSDRFRPPSRSQSEAHQRPSKSGEASAAFLDLESIMARSEPNVIAGSCVLKRAETATLVQNALLFFERQRYYLSAWSVMPNHVHVVVTPAAGFSLTRILHSWKSFTAKAINELLDRHGPLWERESFDHLIRSAADWERSVQYTEQNPVAAGLCRSPELWPFSSRGIGFKCSPELTFVDPRSTAFAMMRSRGELPHLYRLWNVFCDISAGRCY